MFAVQLLPLIILPKWTRRFDINMGSSRPQRLYHAFKQGLTFSSPNSPLRHMITKSKILFGISLLSLTGLSASAVDIFDDFNDGNDLGWTHISPLAPFGAPPAFTFTLGGYKISNPASPNPLALGPARAGSLRLDATYTDFLETVDVVDWSTASGNTMGLLARISTPGTGTTNGYAATFDANGAFNVFRITGEAPTPIASAAALPINIANDYRIVFSGTGTSFIAQLFDLANLATPISTIGGTDATYASGNPGVFIYDGSGTATNAPTATFDNFYSAVPEPGSALLACFGAGLLTLRRRRAS